MLELRKFAWLAVALLVVFVGNATAGDFAESVLSFDTTTGEVDAAEFNTNEGVSTLSLSGAAGDRFEVELFFDPATAPVRAFQVQFDLDTSKVTVQRFKYDADDAMADADTPGYIPLAATEDTLVQVSYASGEGISDPNTTFEYVLPNGYLGTVRFELEDSLAATDELTIGVVYYALTDTNDVTDTLQTVAAIALNGTPKIATPATGTQMIDADDGASVTVTVSNVAIGDSIAWALTTTGATVTVTGQTALTFTTVATATSETITINVAGGEGAATVAVAATVGGVTLDLADLVFDVPTPVELASFGGEFVEDHVMLSWSTASQTNNAGWRVLRSADGETYEALSEFVTGAGTSDELLS